ncbi:Luciferin 2-monooxygenase [Gossypium arboreum]|uniref:Luciferin 2-monooxygenase n=1 Tax=Gossypium arboreum TaxID=29729 RepID=A0A0B0MAC0_GOSAR|nr:Luciferin 2-monooxygenase [Gossypium arboreum]KHG16918.1 Luciferin 2-monooxygenase [Gossypium arboreum]
MVLHGITYRCQCHTWSYMGSHIDADSPTMFLRKITYRCQSHVPDMVLHGIVHNPNVMTFVS